VDRVLAPSVEDLWSNPCQVKSKTEKMAPVIIHILRLRAGLVGPVSG